MKKFFSRPGIQLLKFLNLYSLYLLRTHGYLKDTGWFKSFKSGMPVDSHEEPIPWFTYPAISFLENRIHDKMKVFEYGCGNSTLWWARRVKRIVSCEHEYEWYLKIHQLRVENAELHHISLDSSGWQYARFVGRYKDEYDIIVIDGRDRVHCAMNCVSALKENGVIVWDNSDRESDVEGYSYLNQEGFKRMDFTGMGPINAYSWCSSIFYRPDNCLLI